MTRLRLVALLLGAVLLVACGGSAAPAGLDGERRIAVAGGGAYTDISVARLQAMLKAKDFVFVNVHIPFEGDIAGTDLSIAYDQIERHLDQLPADRAAKIVLYCRSGRMSTEAAEALARLGYTNVSNLADGMVAWEQAGLPLVGK